MSEYNDEQLKIYQSMQQELEDSQSREKQLATALHNQMGSMGDSQTEENLIKWQLDMNNDLDKIYHLLRGDKLGYDENGDLAYIPEEDPDLRPFNNYGVQLLMNIMSYYLNRNTILSNYDEKTITWKVFDIGNEISDLIFNKYEDMMVTIDLIKEMESIINKKVTRLRNGIYVVNIEYKNGDIVYEEIGDSLKEYIKEILDHHIKEKVKLYPIIVRELVDTIHSAYLRAYHGGERESLRTARTVTQSEPLSKGGYPVGNIKPVKSKWYSPGSW